MPTGPSLAHAATAIDVASNITIKRDTIHDFPINDYIEKPTAGNWRQKKKDKDKDETALAIKS